MGKVGNQAFVNATSDMKPAIKQTLKPILERLKNSCGDAVGASPVAAAAKKERSKSREPQKESKPMNSFAKAAVEKKEKTTTAPQSARGKPPAASKEPAADGDEVVIKTLNRAKRQIHDQR